MHFFSLSALWALKDQVLALLLALRDPRTPISGKLFALASIAYLFSPVDIVLDIIPFAGILDDLIVVPFGLWLSRQRIPPEVFEAAREEAKKYSGMFNTIAGVLLAITFGWLLVAIGLIYFLVRPFF